MKKSKVYNLYSDNVCGVTIVTSPEYSALLFGFINSRDEVRCSYAVAEYVANKIMKLNLGIKEICHFFDLVESL